MKRYLLLISLFSLPAEVSAKAKSIEVQGHRGARAMRPENTLPAFEYAIEQGVDVLELDLAVTKDGVLVISHDPHINPVLCNDKNGKTAKEVAIHSLTLAEVKSYDCGAKQNPKFPTQVPVPGSQIPTLEEFLEKVEQSKNPNAKHLEFNIETKSFPKKPSLSPAPHEFSELVIKTLKKHKVFARSVLQSFDYRTLVEARKIDKKSRLSVLTSSDETRTDYIPLMEELKPEVLSPNWEEISAAEVKAIQKKGIRVIPWTANTPEAWEKLTAMKVDGIISDNPAALIAFLKSKKLR